MSEFEKCQAKPVMCGCGGEAKIIESGARDGKYFVSCMECRTDSGYYDTKAEAVEAWNTAMGTNVQKCAKDARCKEQTTKVEHIDMKNVNNLTYMCFECGQYFHRTSWGRPVKFCSFCGARLDWSEDE